MTGETDLDRLLADLRPRLDEAEYAFGFVPSASDLPPGVSPVGTFREAEGLTIILPAAELAEHDIAHSGGWARITLEVHSALAAVGLTAAVATALAAAGIGANMVAAYHHDHVFVPWDRRHDALEALCRLASNAAIAESGAAPDRRAPAQHEP